MSDFKRWCRIQVVALFVAMPVATTCASALLSMAIGQFIVTWTAFSVLLIGLLISGSWSIVTLFGLWRMPDTILACGLYGDGPTRNDAVTQAKEATAAFDQAVA